ncbi:MAG: hypothetical protein ACYTGN_06205 [Planctomycetota bacterium]
MQRVILFLLLTLGIPGSIYWAANGYEPAFDTLNRFLRETGSLRGKPAPDPAPEPEPEKQPEAEDEPGADSGPDPEETDKPDTPGTPPAEAQRTPLEKGQALFDEGKFAAAAATLSGHDEEIHALALLGVALGQAMPLNIPSGTYYVVTTQGGGEFEGFGDETGGQLRLTSAGGRSMTLPLTTIQSRIKLPRAKALDRIERKIQTQATGRMVTGPRLFALIAEAFAIGRPSVVAPMLDVLLQYDEQDPFFLSSVRSRIAPEHQDEIYRAFGRCQRMADVEPEVTASRAPTAMGNNKVRSKPKQRSSIRSEKARKLVKQAGPHRAEGKKLHSKVFKAGLKEAKLKDVEAAISELEKAMELYEKALEIEDSNEIHALTAYCSKLAFQLRFWREQLGGK